MPEVEQVEQPPDELLYSARDVQALLNELAQHVKYWKGDECVCDEDECPYMEALYPPATAADFGGPT